MIPDRSQTYVWNGRRFMRVDTRNDCLPFAGFFASTFDLNRFTRLFKRKR